MTVLSTTLRVQEQGNGSKQDFDFSFPCQSVTHLLVYKVARATEIATLLSYGVDYTAVLSTTGDGGTVTYTVAPTSDQDSLIYREVSLTQVADVPSNNILREEQIETALDKAFMAVQQLDEKIERCVKVSVASTDDPDAIVDNLAAAAAAAVAAQAAAEAAQTAAETAETNAETAETNAELAAASIPAKASQAEAEAGSVDNVYMTPLKTAQAIAAQAGGASAVETSFTNASLTAGVLTVTHNGALSAGYTAIVTVINNSGAMVIPDQVNTFAANSFKVDLTSYGTLTGTWFCTYIVKG